MTTVLVIGKTPDQLLIRAFEALEKEYGKDDWGFQGESDFTQSLDSLRNRKGSSFLVNTAHIKPTNTNLIVNFRRSFNGQYSPYYDEVVFEPNRRPAGVEALLRVEEILR